MATNKIIMNGEEHTIEHQGLCVLNLKGPARTLNYNRCKLVSGEMVDGAIMYIETDGGPFENFTLNDVEYNLRPAIKEGNDMASGYLLGRIIFIRNNWPNPEN